MSIADQARKVPDDEQSVDAITTTLRDTDATATAVRTYERERKNRAEAAATGRVARCPARILRTPAPLAIPPRSPTRLASVRAGSGSRAAALHSPKRLAARSRTTRTHPHAEPRTAQCLRRRRSHPPPSMRERPSRPPGRPQKQHDGRQCRRVARVQGQRPCLSRIAIPALAHHRPQLPVREQQERQHVSFPTFLCATATMQRSTPAFPRGRFASTADLRETQQRPVGRSRGNAKLSLVFHAGRLKLDGRG